VALRFSPQCASQLVLCLFEKPLRYSFFFPEAPSVGCPCPPDKNFPPSTAGRGLRLLRSPFFVPASFFWNRSSPPPQIYGKSVSDTPSFPFYGSCLTRFALSDDPPSFSIDPTGPVSIDFFLRRFRFFLEQRSFGVSFLFSIVLFLSQTTPCLLRGACPPARFPSASSLPQPGCSSWPCPPDHDH